MRGAGVTYQCRWGELQQEPVVGVPGTVRTGQRYWPRTWVPFSPGRETVGVGEISAEETAVAGSAAGVSSHVHAVLAETSLAWAVCCCYPFVLQR